MLKMFDKIKFVWSKTNRWHKGLLILLLVELRLLPANQLGFKCNDPALSHPFTGDTISWKALLATTVLLPLVIMLIVERKYGSDMSAKSKQQALCWYKEYLFGLLSNLVIIQVLKLIVGSPRPHFFDTCSPKETLTCKGSEYVPSYTCTKAYWLNQSDRSFPSGHTSLAFYTGLFLAYYLHRRIGSSIKVRMLQALCVTMALFCSVSRVTDRRHHWWDVLAGFGIAVTLFLYIASSKNLFRSPYRWIMLITNTTDVSVLWNSSVLADSDVVLAERTGDHFKLAELYKPSTTGPMKSTARGFFNGTLVDIRPYRELFRRRRDVARQTITMSNVIQDSNTTRYHLPREDGMEPQYDSIPKICWMNVLLALEMLNATPAYVFSYRWGYKVERQWSGMIDDLNSGRADLGTNCVVNIERLDVVSYTDMLAPFKVRFIFRQPPLPYVSNIFSLPFSNSVWLSIFVCAILSTVALYVTSVWELNYEQKSATQLGGKLGDAMLLTMSAVSQQGCIMEPKRAPGRIMVFILFTALMALYAAYSANIVVLLQAPSHSIRNLQQLASAKITIAANDVDYNHFVFGLFKDPVRVIIHKRIEPEKGQKQFYDIKEGVERIRQGLFAFHSIVEPVHRRIEQTFLEAEKCDLMEVNFLTGFDPFVPVKKDSPYLEMLRVAFKRLRESGIQSAISKRLQVPKPRCSQKAFAFSSVGLLDMKPVLILMLYGVAISVTIGVGEIIFFQISKRRVVTSERYISFRH